MATSGISSTLGSYSGITMTEIDKLIEAESVPLTKMTKTKSQLTEQQNAWKDVRLRLNTLFTKIENLQKNETFNTKKVTSSLTDKVSITATDKAQDESYQIVVDRLATSSKRVSGEISGLTGKTIYEGLSLTGNLELDTKDGKKVTIDVEEKDSLKEITNKINLETKNTGIKASLINNRLVLSKTETGEEDFSISGSLVNSLGLSEADSTYTKGQNAKFRIDGMEVTRSSNEINDVIENVTIHLHGETKEAAKLSVVTDTDKLVTSVKELVDQYNTVMDFIAEKSSIGDPSKSDNKAGVLNGDSALSRLQTSLRLLMTASPEGNTSTAIAKPSEIGIDSKDRTSTIVFNEDKFKEALKNDPAAVQNFFFKKLPVEVESIDESGNKKIETENKDFGFSVGIKELLNTYLNDDKGKKSIYKTKTETLDQNLSDLDKKMEKFSERIEKKRTFYITKFTKLDQVMMNAESQMAYLQSQINSFTSN